MIASEEKAGKGRQTKRIVENKDIRGGEETGERREKKGRGKALPALDIPCLEFASSITALLSQSSIQEIKRSPGNCN